MVASEGQCKQDLDLRFSIVTAPLFATFAKRASVTAMIWLPIGNRMLNNKGPILLQAVPPEVRAASIVDVEDLQVEVVVAEHGGEAEAVVNLENQQKLINLLRPLEQGNLEQKVPVAIPKKQVEETKEDLDGRPICCGLHLSLIHI